MTQIDPICLEVNDLVKVFKLQLCGLYFYALGTLVLVSKTQISIFCCKFSLLNFEFGDKRNARPVV